MSIRVMDRVWRSGKFKGGTLLVLLAMADFADDDGGSIFPTKATLALKARVSTRQVQNSLRELEHDGVLVLVEEAPGRPGQAAEYAIDLDYLPDEDGSKKCKAGKKQTGAKNSPNGRRIFQEGEQNLPETGAKSARRIKNRHRTTIEPSGGEPSGESPPSKPVVEAVALDDIDLAIQAYNQAAMKCPQGRGLNGMVICKERTSNREKLIRARLQKHGLEGWRAAMEQAFHSDFVSGRAPRGRDHENFKVNIGWLAKAENFAKLVEGQYDGNNVRRGSLEEGRLDLMDWVQEQRDKDAR